MNNTYSVALANSTQRILTTLEDYGVHPDDIRDSFGADRDGYYWWHPDILDATLDHPRLTIRELEQMAITALRNEANRLGLIPQQQQRRPPIGRQLHQNDNRGRGMQPLRQQRSSSHTSRPQVGMWTGARNTGFREERDELVVQGLNRPPAATPVQRPVSGRVIKRGEIDDIDRPINETVAAPVQQAPVSNIPIISANEEAIPCGDGDSASIATFSTATTQTMFITSGTHKMLATPKAIIADTMNLTKSSPDRYVGRNKHVAAVVIPVASAEYKVAIVESLAPIVPTNSTSVGSISDLVVEIQEVLGEFKAKITDIIKSTIVSEFNSALKSGVLSNTSTTQLEITDLTDLLQFARVADGRTSIPGLEYLGDNKDRIKMLVYTCIRRVALEYDMDESPQTVIAAMGDSSVVVDGETHQVVDALVDDKLKAKALKTILASNTILRTPGDVFFVSERLNIPLSTPDNIKGVSPAELDNELGQIIAMAYSKIMPATVLYVDGNNVEQYTMARNHYDKVMFTKW